MSKSVIVIGSSGGIGRATVRVFADAGWTVFGFQRGKTSAGKVDRFFEVRGDVTLKKDVKKLIAVVAKRSGGPDAVVFTPSAPLQPKSFAEKNWHDFEKHFSLSAKGFLNISQLLIDKIKTGKKIRFVVVATEGIIGRPTPYLADYFSAKAALVALAKSLAVEIGKWGSVVNIVSPGFTDTPLLSIFPKKVVEAAAISNPLRRIGRPIEVAKAIFFLASGDNEYLNGVNITVNGGNVMF